MNAAAAGAGAFGVAPARVVGSLVGVGLAAAAAGQLCPWTQLAGDGPTRVNERLAYDSVRGRVVLYGGVGTGTGAETWEWDGAAWSQQATTGPGVRLGHAMAFDGARTVLFGGTTSGGGAGDTWVWDGAAWSQLQVPGPAPRTGAGMVYDTAHGRVLLFGGTTGSPPYPVFTDLWAWDGAAWTLLANDWPSRSALVVYDSVRSRLVAYAGVQHETWEWDGVTWSLRASGVGPSVWGSTATAFDPVRGRTVLFGGIREAQPQTVGEVWEWDGAVWTLRATTGPGARSDHAMVWAGPWKMLLHGGRPQNYLVVLGDTWSYDGSATAVPLIISEQPAPLSVSPGDAAEFRVSATGQGALSYRWFRDSVMLTDDGRVTGAAGPVLRINPVACGDSGFYTARVTDACAPAESVRAGLTVACPCYPNCDASIIQPVLNVNDFSCFINRYAAGDPYCNCDGSTVPPVLNINDFLCFMNAYATGCP